MDNVNISASEYKKLVLGNELQAEREQLKRATADYVARRDEVEGYLQKNFKCKEEYYMSRIDELLTKIKKYESNWFVKLFLNDDNNKKPKFPWS